MNLLAESAVQKDAKGGHGRGLGRSPLLVAYRQYVHDVPFLIQS